ncbi:MAG: hypothetical protein COY80_03395 [Candidatus Pacebacteria bacterium CG_4_10_14_0_8_um_filter_42_14]|nr:MAG: hypothetical protein COY80_03395 [Candidatus Pacebacteria bacterium CG_4_10_14_0_8_um_filter_42_14]
MTTASKEVSCVHPETKARGDKKVEANTPLSEAEIKALKEKLKEAFMSVFLGLNEEEAEINYVWLPDGNKGHYKIQFYRKARQAEVLIEEIREFLNEESQEKINAFAARFQTITA